MKRKLIVALIIIFIIGLGFVPFKKNTYFDGGTVDYQALFYRKIKWNKIRDEYETKTGTEVFWLPNNFRSIDEYDDIFIPNLTVYKEKKPNYKLLLKKGSACYKNKYKSACWLSVAPYEIEYEEELRITSKEKIIIDTIENIDNITVYDNNGKEYTNVVQLNDNIITFSNIENGFYYISFRMTNSEGYVFYYFKAEYSK